MISPTVGHSAHRARNTVQIVILILLAVAFTYGVFEVVRLSWVCDDAFVSFRYARNLVNGLGLVFNAGEHVEGYTNFLWTVIIAGGMLIKLDPVMLSMVLGALSFFATVGIFAFLSWKLFAGGSGQRLFIPITSLALLVHHECHVWATGGLETMWTTALVSLGFALLILGRSPRTLLTAGFVLVAAAMSRPDVMIFYAVAVIYVASTSRPFFRSLGIYLLPLVILYLPYWIIRYNYYGYPFPNTYYAKSADLPYYGQGLTYVWLYLRSYYVLIFAPIVAAFLVKSQFREYRRFPITDHSVRAVLLAVLFVFPFAVYVVRSGGDFMFARFLIPVTPMLFILMEIFVRTAWPKTKYALWGAALIVFAVLFRYDNYRDRKQINYVADEPQYYPANWHERAEQIGGDMRDYFEGTAAKLAFRGYNVYAYYSDAPVAIETCTGLTDEFIAHQLITKRGRPGHEKPAPLSYLRQRGVNFELKSEVVPHSYFDSVSIIQFGELPLDIITFDNALMDHLKQFPGIQFTDIRPVIDSMIGRIEGLSPEQVRPWYEFLKNYYFDHNVDSARQRPFVEALK